MTESPRKGDFFVAVMVSSALRPGVRGGMGGPVENYHHTVYVKFLNSMLSYLMLEALSLTPKV